MKQVPSPARKAQQAISETSHALNYKQKLHGEKAPVGEMCLGDPVLEGYEGCGGWKYHSKEQEDNDQRAQGSLT